MTKSFASDGKTVAQLKNELRDEVEKLHPDDWQNVWLDMLPTLGTRKKPIKEKIAELKEKNDPGVHQQMQLNELERLAQQNKKMLKDVTEERDTERERREAAEKQAQEITEDRDVWQRMYTEKDVECRSLKRPFNEQETIDALESAQKKNKKLEQKLGHYDTMQTQFKRLSEEVKKHKGQNQSKPGPDNTAATRKKDEELRKVRKQLNDANEDLEEVKGDLEDAKRDLCDKDEELNAALKENKDLTEQIAYKEALGPKPSDEVEALKAENARLNKQYVDPQINTMLHGFMSEFLPDIVPIEEELGIYGRGGNEDFSKFTVVKKWYGDYNDETYSYVTWNSRRILEKVLCDTMLYDRMQAFMGVEPGRRIHHKPRADQTERNARTIEVCTRIWGEGFSSESELVVVGN